jgi:hypothetical protein
MPYPFTGPGMRGTPASTTTPSTDYLFGGFDRNKGGRLAGYTEKYIVPEIGTAQKRRSQIESTFLGFLDPAAGERYVTEGANRIVENLLQPGGAAAEGVRAVRGQSVARGWGTQGGDLSRQETKYLGDLLGGATSAYIGQALPGLYEGAAGRAAGAYGLTMQELQDWINSGYTGLAGAESLKLSQPKKGLLGLGTPIL